ncbi:MAG: phytoene desaturase family protein [Hydrogenophaga sp.]|nr:phytoene desaturase family protein [Hydrogenophaga sp.]
MSEHRVVVIGAGMGGLACALRLAQQGLDVTVVEAAPAPGGKLRQPLVGGVPIDSGPTVFTMRWVFDQLFAAVGTTLEAELRIQRLPVLARHWWDDGSQLDLFADPAASLDAVARFAGAAEARRFAAFCERARAVYQTLEGPYIRQPRPNPLGLTRDIGLKGLATLTGLGPLSSLWSSLGRQFTDPRLRQLFARYATYTGSSPWQAPATLMLIAQVEMDGVWSIDGGMHALARCLERLARARGAVFHYGLACERIELQNGRVRGVRLANGDSLRADSVVFNGDAAALRAGLLGEPLQRAVPARAPQRSLSALTWSLHAPAGLLPLDRHNVFFQHPGTAPYASEFSDIFARGRLPAAPTVYVCAQDRGTGPAPPPGSPERLLALVNAPASGDRHTITPEELDQCETQAFQLLSRSGLQLSPRGPASLRTTPADFHRLFPATGGALYGQASHGWGSAFSRPVAGTPVPGLYLAGGSVHPGPGVPMATLSGQFAAEALLASPALTRRYHPAATSGGTSTPSATTASTASP